MGALSTNAVFKGMGIGDEGASALSATTNWILRQGLGKCASITFAYRSGAAIGTDSKRYRLLADIVNDCALTINLLSAHVSPSIRPYIYACSSVCWAIVGIAGSCTRTALTIHQARANNAADVQAKDQSQETLVELVGLAVSYFIVSMIGNHPFAVLVLFAIFISLHLTCNYNVCDTSDVEPNSSATNAAAVQGVTFSPQCQGFTKLNAASLSSSAFFSK